jgi:hypothetical protein
MLRDVTLIEFVEGRFEGSHCEKVEIMLSFGASYAAVTMMLRLRVLEALLEIMKEIVGKILRFQIVAIPGLITC